jgi:hypothetical protein
MTAPHFIAAFAVLVVVASFVSNTGRGGPFVAGIFIVVGLVGLVTAAAAERG